MGRQRLSGLYNAGAIGGADGHDMFTRSGLPRVAPWTPGDIGEGFLQLDRLPSSTIDVQLDGGDAADTCKSVTTELCELYESPNTGGPLVTAATTDRTAANLATITDIYAAFGRGDVPTILDKVAPNCRWGPGETIEPNARASRPSSHEPARQAWRTSSPP
jgi:hypothetical protein